MTRGEVNSKLNVLNIPGTNKTLRDGSIVSLARFPGVKWILHYGWYKYLGQQSMGWYFCSIPGEKVIPVNDQDLNTLTLISDDCGCNHRPGPPGHRPPAPNEGPNRNWELDRTFVTVQTIAERDLLNTRLLPDGRIVKVMQTPEGVTKYYTWNQVNQVWDSETFGIDLSKYYTAEEVDAIKDLISTDLEDLDDGLSKLCNALKDVSKKLNNVERSTQWKPIVSDTSYDIK